MKNVMKRLMVCGLCVSMLVGCGTRTDTSKTGTGKKNIEVGNLAGNSQEDDMSELNSIIELKAKYEDQEKYEYTDPMYNLEKNHVFTYDVGEAFFKSEEYEAFKVYSDSNFQNTVNIKIEDNYDDDKITISPSLVFSYENEEDSRTDGTWGSRSKFWLVQYMDTKTGKELDKPIVTVFSIAQELNTPTMKQSVGGDGYYKLSWSKVDGADYQEVYEYDKGLDYASLAVTTENLECSNADFAHVKKYEEEFKEEYKDTEIDVDTQKEVCTGFAGYLAAVLQRHKRIVGTRQHHLDARLVLTYESRYAVGELQCQVLLQHLVQAGTLVFAAMSGIEHPHQRAQLPGCACQRQEQRDEDDKTFHTAKLLKIRSPSGIGNRFLGRQKLLEAKFAAWWFPLPIFPRRRECSFAWKNALRCDDLCSALRWSLQRIAMRDAARCVFQRRTTAKPRQGIIKGKTYGRGDGSRAPWALS